MTGESQSTRILKLGIDEMFEDLTYNVAYQEVLNRLKANGMDDGILKDAINSGITIMFSSALMLYIQKQEAVLDKIVNIAVKFLIATVTPLFGAIKGAIKKYAKGRAASMFSSFLGISTSDRIAYGQLIVSSSDVLFSRKQAEQQFNFRADAAYKQRELLLHSKDQQLNYAKAKVDSFNQTLLFKLLTSRFTAQDKEILRRITGSTEVDIDKLNEVASFMYVKDDAGNITGLSEQFMTLLNGLGYFNSKGKK